jgi:O-glycosyl hydrolase
MMFWYLFTCTAGPEFTGTFLIRRKFSRAAIFIASPHFCQPASDSAQELLLTNMERKTMIGQQNIQEHLMSGNLFKDKEPAKAQSVSRLNRPGKRKGFKLGWAGVRTMLAVGFAAQAGIAAAQNLATNPGFETGNTTGWFAFGSPSISAQSSQVHSGSFAGQVTNRTATFNGIAQSFQGVLQANQTYSISAWLRLVSGSSQTMQLTMQKVDGNGTAYSAVASGSVSTNGWTQLIGQYTFTPSGTLTSLTLYAEMPSSSNTSYYIDDLVVQSNVTGTSNGACSVDWSTVFQRIDGFGASSAWDGSWTTSQADMFFSTNNGTGTTFDGKSNFGFTGIGLSLLRNHITFAGSTSASAVPSTVETSIMQLAQARGARVWSTPWTPAAGFKSTSDIYDTNQATGGGINGGSYRGSGNNITNLNYASQLANYVGSMKTNFGVNLYALSIQNEPDANVTSYEACQWTGAQIHDFATNLFNALAARGLGSTKIILPESQNWTDPKSLAGPTLSDPNVLADIDIVANHNYVANNVVGDLSTPAALSVSGKALWETEVAQLGGTYDGSITNAIYWAGRVHLFMTAAQANAWHFWWLVPSGSDNEALVDTNGLPAKRMYALGQFARFVRPNYYRINITTNSSSAEISAYKDSVSSNFAIVAINPGLSNVIQVFNLANVTGVSNVTPWVTSATMSLSNQTPVTVSGSSFTYTLPPLSVVTFVGQSGSSAPSVVPTTLTLVSGANPSTYGNTVTFTATVKTNNVAVGGISGETVTFYNGASQLGTGTLNSGGQADYTTTASQLPAGPASITAVYGGDVSYSNSTNSPALSQTVNQATLTAGLTGTVSRNYNGNTTATLAVGNYTLSGVVSGDTVNFNNPAAGTYDTKNAGTGKTVNVAGLAISGGSAANYTLASTSISGAVGRINATNITVTAAVNSRAYDGSTNAAAVPTITSGSLQSGDSAGFTEAYTTKDVGTGKILTPAGSINDGNSGNNYAITFVNNTAGAITARVLTVTAVGVDKVYDGTTDATVTLNDNRTAGDVFTDSYGSASFSDRNVGVGKSASVSGINIVGADAGNYSFNTTAGATANITAQALTVMAAANSKTYDGGTNAAAVPTITLGSVQSGDSAGFTEAYDTANVGVNLILTPAGTVSDGNSGSNYLYTFVASSNGTISAATLTYTANTASMIYGAAVPVLGGSVNGFVGGDTQGNATTGALIFTTPATSSSAAGSYPIDGSGLTANNGNYTFAQAAGNATALSILPLVTPAFVGQGITVGGGTCQLSFSAQPGQTYRVLATSDLRLPLDQWLVLTNGTFDSGPATVTDSSTNVPQRFYRIASP